MFLFVILAPGCVKDVDIFIPDQILDVEGDIDRFFDAVQTAPSVIYTLNARYPATLVTPRKSVVVFKPNALLTQDGNYATGEVIVTVHDILTSGEILLRGTSTQSDGRLISSAGQIRVSASQQGAALHLDPLAEALVFTNLQTGQHGNIRSELFYGTEIQDVFNPDTPIPNWKEADDDPTSYANADLSQWAAITDSQQIVTGYGYATKTARLGDLQLGALNDPPQTQQSVVHIILPDGYSARNAAVFLVFQDQQSVIRLKGALTSTDFYNNFIPDQRVHLPAGAQAELIVIAEKGIGKYAYARVTTTLKPQHQEYVIPADTELQDIIDDILSL